MALTAIFLCFLCRGTIWILNSDSSAPSSAFLGVLFCVWFSDGIRLLTLHWVLQIFRDLEEDSFCPWTWHQPTRLLPPRCWAQRYRPETTQGEQTTLKEVSLLQRERAATGKLLQLLGAWLTLQSLWGLPSAMREVSLSPADWLFPESLEEKSLEQSSTLTAQGALYWGWGQRGCLGTEEKRQHSAQRHPHSLGPRPPLHHSLLFAEGEEVQTQVRVAIRRWEHRAVSQAQMLNLEDKSIRSKSSLGAGFIGESTFTSNASMHLTLTSGITGLRDLWKPSTARFSGMSALSGLVAESLSRSSMVMLSLHKISSLGRRLVYVTSVYAGLPTVLV